METAVLYAIVGLLLIATGAMLEHYTHAPKLDTDELFMVMDLIDAECDYEGAKASENYDRVRNMRSELADWMDQDTMCTISKELQSIIDRATDVDRTNFD